jgi:phosphoglycerate dehydrogenase-like enzyme
LDDYQARAGEFADWGQLDAEVVFFTEHVTGRELIGRLRGFDVVVAMRERTPFPREVLEQLPDLRLLVTTGPGNASIDVSAASGCGITVCGTRGRDRVTVEIAWALLLAGYKNLALEDRALRGGTWQLGIPRELAGRRLGLVGLGRLGAAMVPVARAFGMEVAAWSQNLTAGRAAETGAVAVGKQELFKTSDVISIHMRLSERSRGLVGAADLALMKQGALLVNTSRGPIVDEDALLSALRSGRIRASLDVFDREPLAEDHPLLSLDNVVLTPHLGYVSEENYRLFFGDVVDGVRAFLSGTPVRVVAPAA